MSYYTVDSGTKLFREAMICKGITPPLDIHADGSIHRFHINKDKPGTKNGWYVLFTNTLICGAFGSWKEGSSHSWCEKNTQSMSNTELEQQAKKIQEAKRKYDIERKRVRQNAAKLAESKYYAYPLADPKHPYLVRKQIKPFYARQNADNLVLPVIDFNGGLKSLQFISSDGSKRFLPNGAINGNFIPLQGSPSDNVKNLICEGFATGASLADVYPNACVIAACNAGNLKSVAVIMRQYLPNAEIIICADDDQLNPNNPGLLQGYKAAVAAKALFTKPEWPKNAPQSLSDFNDLALWLSREVA